MERTALLPGGIGRCKSCNALPHCLGAVGSGTPVMHCLTAWGQWALLVVGVSCRAYGEVERGTPAWGDGEYCPRGGQSPL